MLYFKALVEGLDALPEADPGIRAQLDARAAAEGWPALHAELGRVDPATAARLAPLDAQRFDTMLAAGFVDEVRALRARGDLHPDLPSMRCVGYRQAWEALDAGDLSTIEERGIAATRQLAKRQITWLRSMPQRSVVPCDAPDALERTLSLADERLEALTR